VPATPTTSDDRAPITIVIPVYGDLPSLERCVQSVIDYADEPWIQTLLVNDVGPEADAIEARLLQMIGHHPRMRYERNPRNLGFVGTCNRAVFELDSTENDILLLNSDAELTPGAVEELRDVLHLSPRHGAVCPRSNHATIATIPVLHSSAGLPTPERAREVSEGIRAELPRYYVAPVAVGFCLLIRRRVIRNHGLFDEIYGAGYNEENDFCMRINGMGYSSVLANRAFVLHAASSSFGEQRRHELDARNFKILEERFPYYTESVTRFAELGYDAADRFADLLVPPAQPRPRRVLLDVHHLSKHYDGTTKNVLSLLELLAADPPEGIDVALAAYPDVADFFHLDRYGMRVLDYDQIDEVFDLGITAVPITSIGQLAKLTRHCARIAMSFLDAIALRTYALVTTTPMKPTVVQAGLRWADRVITISSGALSDMEELYPGLIDGVRARAVVITQGSGRAIGRDHDNLTSISRLSPQLRQRIADGGYALVVGNGFAHKQVVPTLLALEDAGVPLIAMGDKLLAGRFPETPILISGTLTEDEMDALYEGAAVVIAPSAYEGFGLSLAEAAHHGKRVVAFDTVVAREVIDTLGLDGAELFGTFDELPEAVRRAVAAGDIPRAEVRSLRDYAFDFWNAAITLLDEPLDLARLRSRDQELIPLISIGEGALKTATRLLTLNTEILASNSFRVARALASASGRARRLLRIRTVARQVRIDRNIIDQT
jgi:GT2 family glycosyltransferase